MGVFPGRPGLNAVVSVAEVTKTGLDPLVLVKTVVNDSGDDLDVGELLGKSGNTLGRCNEVKEENSLLGDSSGNENLHGHHGRATGGKHGVQQEDVSVGDVLGQLVVEESGLSGLLVSLDENLSDSNGPAAVSQTLLHGLSSSHDGDTTNLSLKCKTLELGAGWRLDELIGHGKLVETLLDEQTDDSVRVEDEVRPRGVLVSDDGVETKKLAGLWEHVDVGRNGRSHWMCGIGVVLP